MAVRRLGEGGGCKGAGTEACTQTSGCWRNRREWGQCGGEGEDSCRKPEERGGEGGIGGTEEERRGVIKQRGQGQGESKSGHIHQRNALLTYL